MNKYFTASGEEALLNYRWPGNVRELKNVVERAMVMSSSEEISAGNFFLHTPPEAGLPGEHGEVSLKAVTERLELDYIERAYQRAGNVRDAAKSLGMDAATFVRKRKKYREKYGVLQK